MLNHGHKYSQCIVCMCETGVVFGKKLAKIAKTFFTREVSYEMQMKLILKWFDLPIRYSLPATVDRTRSVSFLPASHRGLKGTSFMKTFLVRMYLHTYLLLIRAKDIGFQQQFFNFAHAYYQHYWIWHRIIISISTTFYPKRFKLRPGMLTKAI